MLWPPAYYPVYHLHFRLPEPSLHANPLIQTPPIPHMEGSHLIQWAMSDERKLSSTVRGDSQRFALKDYDTGKFIPHLPIPLMAGPFLLETLTGSKYQVLFHQPNVLLDGQAVGVFQWGIAPPWRCIELKLPLPKFLARAGRASAARVKPKRLSDAGEQIDKAWKAEKAAESAWESADSLKKGMAAVERLDAAGQKVSSAVDEMNDAENQDERRKAWLRSAERQERARDMERAALARKRELDRLQRNTTGPHKSAAAAAWAQEAREQDELARRQRGVWKSERASQRHAEELLARERGQKKKENPAQQATGESNAGLSAPSLLAHLPFPATVEIQVSWSQIRKTWVAGLIGAAAEMLKYYVGFVFDGVLAPGRGKVTTILLDLLKSGINDTLIDGGAKYLVDGKWPLKISKKLGPVKLSASLEPDSATGTHKWKVTLEHKVKDAVPSKGSIEGHGWTPEKVDAEVAGRRAEHTFSKPLVDYSHGVPAVN